MQVKADQTMFLKDKNQLELCKILLQCRDTHIAQFNHFIESAINNVLLTTRITNESITNYYHEQTITLTQ